MVFVKEWGWKSRRMSDKDFEEYIPRRLYLPDGREIPVCVLLAEFAARPEPIPHLRFPSYLVGGGFPVMSRVHGEERRATLAAW